MLGHKLCGTYRYRYDVWCAARGDFAAFAGYGLTTEDRFIGEFDARSMASVKSALEACRPDVVINCVGIVKQSPQALSPIDTIEINALFPHRLAEACRSSGARLIHISTDCVFSGKKGLYTEQDIPDAEDLYGRTKLLGELTEAKSLTLRTSIIGREMRRSFGLVEWLLQNQGGRVRGYTKAIFSGLTTAALADAISVIIDGYPHLEGLYHVSSDPISKYELLLLLRESYNLQVDIESCADVVIDRSLDSSRFRAATGFHPETWPMMIAQMAADVTPYDAWREQRDS